MNVLGQGQELLFGLLAELYSDELRENRLIGPEGEDEVTDLARESVIVWRSPTAIGLSAPFATLVGSVDYISPHRALVRELADRFLAVGYEQTNPRMPRPSSFRLMNLSSYEVHEGHYFRISINYTMLFREQA
jgi:hypothetical protein